MSSGKAKLKKSPPRIFPSLAGRGGLDSGVHRLIESPMLINNVAPTPDFVLVGSDAGAGGWTTHTYPASPVTLALQAGTAPSYNQDTPYLGTFQSVLFNGGGYFSAADLSIADLTTEDFVFEVVMRLASTGTKYVCGTRPGSGAGWQFYTATNIVFYVSDGTHATATSQDSWSVGAWYHILVFGDRSGSMKMYTNNLGHTAGSIATVESCTNQPLVVGAAPGGGTPANVHLAFAAMWKQAAWLDSHLQPTVVAQRFALLNGTRPMISIAGTKTLAAGGNTGSCYQEKVTSGVSSLFYVAAGAPRFRQIVDGSGRTFTGMEIEAAETNTIYSSQSVGDVWYTTGGVTQSATPVVLPDGTTSTSAVLAETVDGSPQEHYAGQTAFAASTVDYVYTLSILAKAFGRDFLRLVISHAGTAKTAYFNLTTGAFGTVNAGLSTHFRSLGNGFYLVEVSRVATNTTATSLWIASGAADGQASYQGDGREAIIVTGMQGSENGAFESSRIDTTTAPVTRAADTPHRISGAAHFGSQGFSLWNEVLCASFTPIRNHHLWTAYKSGSAATDYVKAYIDTSGRLCLASASSGGDAGAVTGPAVNTNVIKKYVVSAGHNLLRLWVDGVAAVSDTVVDIPAGLDTLDWGADEAATNHAGPGVWPGCRYQLVDYPVDGIYPEPIAFTF